MSTADLLRSLAARPGCAQPDRDEARLDPAHAPLDERDTAALLAAARALAAQVVHPGSDPLTPDGDWRSFFPAGDAAELARLVQRSDGELPPHLALLIAFLRLGGHAQRLLNGFTARQLQFQMQQVLGFVPRPAQPDRAHLVIELKKGEAGVELRPEHRFSAGKDARRVEQLYAPLRATWIGRAAVARLASLHRGADQRLRYAPVANSADGFGAAFVQPGSAWPPFGHAGLPEAPVGFALASPLLRLAEGRRDITLTLDLVEPGEALGAEALAASLRAYLSGPQGWIGPLPVTASLQATAGGAQCQLGCSLGADLPAVVDHDATLHAQRFAAGAPVLQLVLAPGAPLPFGAFDTVALAAATLHVEVTGLRGLSLANDNGALDARRAFLPFGAEPVVGSRLLIGCPEALGKPLTGLQLNLRWQGAPADLGSWYAGYQGQARVADGIAARLDWLGPDGAPRQLSVGDLMRRSAGVTRLDPFARLPSHQRRSAGLGRALRESGLRKLVDLDRRERWRLPRVHAAAADGGGAEPPAGSLSLTLEDDFLHGAYRHEAVERLMAIARGETVAGTDQVLAPLRAPYTPKVQEIWLDYAAQSARVALGEATQASFAAAELQFFHVDAFGVSREHAWLSRQRGAASAAVSLLPRHAQAGSWLIGLAGVAGGDSLSLLLQVAEGSADAQATPQTLRWEVLADNAWRELLPGELALDGTGGLRRSGLLQIALPTGVDSEASRVDAPGVWLRASVPAEPRAVCDLIAVHANAVEVGFIDQGNDPQRLAQPLAAGSITKLTTPLPAVKAVGQPYASFGGALREGDAALARRAAERLRHRGRAITAWDAERLVLEAFPGVYRAKCLPHARPGSWLAAGHAMLLVLPDLRQRPAQDRLQPRVDLDTLARIGELLRQRGGLQLQWHVQNPRYRPLQLEFKLKLRPGRAWNQHVRLLNEALVNRLSPWASTSPTPAVAAAANAGAGPDFGDRVLRSALLAFVEAQPYVEHVSDFRLWLEGPDGASATDVAEALPDAPDVILVSAPAHRILELTSDV